MSALHESSLTSLKFLHRGKVRDLYEVDEQHLLIVQTDRLSAFDFILPDPVPNKGEVLTTLSNFWFKKLAHILPNPTDAELRSAVIYMFNAGTGASP